MKLLKICLFVTLITSTNFVLASPAVSVGGAESLSNVCPVRPPATCPQGVHCGSCPICTTPPACEICEGANVKDSECPSYKLDIEHVKGSGLFGGKDDILNLNDQAPSCLTEMYDVVYDACEKANGGGVQTDDCVIGHLRGETSALPLASQEVKSFLDIIKQGYNADCSVLLPGLCDTGTAYYDKSCNPLDIKKIDINKSCDAGKLSWLGTPISLLLDSSLADLSKNSSIVNFSLSPDSNVYVNWKGSEKAPLLVFDPEHNGKIVSGSQLFGEWTFGGKARASLTSKIESDTNADAEAWENGFSALATLDSNMDGKIAGRELASLALWFDANRDAVSDRGEVRSLSDVGITVLYYKNSVKDSVTGDVVLGVGYELESKGVLTQGAAVDWYGVSAKSEVQLIQRKDALASLCNSGTETITDLIAEPSSDFASVKNADPGFSGAWDWNSDETVSAGGMLVFSSGKEGQYTGVSMFQFGLEDTSRQIDFSRAVRMLKLSGSLTGKVGSEKLIFSHPSQDGIMLESVAKLSEDKNHLEGITTAMEVAGRSKKPMSRYSWTAQRHVSK